jgi:c-di-GMP-binding flagellar brake protein YcgR
MKVGTKIFLEKEQEQYRCRIVERREGQLLIDLPVHVETNRTKLFSPGMILRALFTDDDGASYVFETRVQGRELGRIPMLVLEHPGDSRMTRLQRREFVRVATSVDVAVHPKEGQFPPFVTTTADLSGGGTAVYLPRRHSLKENISVECWLVLPMQSGEIHYLCLDSRVLRIFRDKKEINEMASLEFMSAKETERQKLIRYCYEQQLKRKYLTTSV